MIKTEGITEQQKATSQFQFTYAGMMRQLTAPGFIPALCAHEAAHLVYYEMIGPVKYEALPPVIRYDPQKRDFVGHLAEIKLIEVPNCEPGKWKEWLTMMAYAHVAGGVVGRKVFPASDGGDQADKANFRRLCTDLMAHYDGISIEPEVVWKSAQNAVEKQLADHPQIMELIQQRGAEIQSSLGW